MLTEDAHAVVELATQGADLPGVLGEGVLLPRVGDRLEHRDERRRRRDDHVLREAMLEEGRIRLQRDTEEGFTRQEEHDEFRRTVEVLPVLFAGKLGDM